MFRIGGVRLQPTLGKVAWMLMGRIAGALGGGEAQGDDCVAVEDSEMGFALGEVSSCGVAGGTEYGCIVLVFYERAILAQEG